MGYFSGLYDFKSYVHMALGPLFKGLLVYYYYPHFSDTQTEAQRDKVTLPKVPELGNGKAKIKYQVSMDTNLRSLTVSHCLVLERRGKWWETRLIR